jgi:hypothetical protein
MGYAYASGVVSARSAAVWDLVRRFDALPTWHPFVQSCEMMDDAHPAAVGSRRVQRLANGGTATAQLISIDDSDQALVYEMLDGPWEVRNYTATVRVRPITDQEATFVEWWGRFDADAAHVEELEAMFRDSTYEAGVRALQHWFRDARNGEAPPVPALAGNTRALRKD